MSKSRKIEQASRRYRSFFDRAPTKLTQREVEFPDVLLNVGKVSGIMYVTEDGEQYFHEFSEKARPQFAVSPDGKMLVMLGGAFQFTERGIVDRK